MPSISPHPIQAAQTLSAEWTGADPQGPAALYLSAGYDTRALTLTHPAFLAKQSGRMLEEMSFYVFVDAYQPRDDRELNFTDPAGRTQIKTVTVSDHPVGPFDGYLLNLTTKSTTMPWRKVSVLRVRALNDEFANLALEEGWQPHCVISVCDGCCFGGNPRCENEFRKPEKSIQARLKPNWIITDHLRNIRGREIVDPLDGDVIRSTNPHFGYEAEQIAFLSTNWQGPGRSFDGGARLFAFRSTEAAN